ncbi:MAG: PP2C family serine/threonine-protein phosphatase [Pseudomonadota bacterium]
MRFSVYQISRKGGREKNEDRMGYCYTRDSGLFALADGMGGHPEGEVASQLALQTMAALYQRDARPTLADPLRFLQDAVMAGHHQLLRYASEKGLMDTPRTTIVACIMQGDSAYWAHCGDSRLYFVRGDKLLARTRDHSYAELQQTLSSVVPLNERYYNRNVLFTCLGSPGKPVVDTAGPLLLQEGDRIMLCSDGLWGTVDDDVITRHLTTKSISDSVPELVEEALRNGGAKCDNVTMIAMEWESAASDELPGVSTESLGDQVFASTIQASVGSGHDNSAEADDLDEAEIERSIREINEAIKRSARGNHRS